jgi:hypothetical protein
MLNLKCAFKTCCLKVAPYVVAVASLLSAVLPNSDQKAWLQVTHQVLDIIALNFTIH